MVAFENPIIVESLVTSNNCVFLKINIIHGFYENRSDFNKKHASNKMCYNILAIHI